MALTASRTRYSLVPIVLMLLGGILSGCLDTPIKEQHDPDFQDDQNLPSKEPDVSTNGPLPGELNNTEEPGYNERSIDQDNGWQYEVLPPVIALRDSGINPYHVDYRLPEGFDSSQKGYYPEEATLLEITLDAFSYKEAVKTDREIWESVEPGVLYAINGTRIVGAIGFTDRDCEDGGPSWDCEHILLDYDGHGSVVASSAAGEETGTCPECRIVMTTWGTYTDFMGWMLEQDWIDVFSYSRTNLANVAMNLANASKHWTENGRTWFNGAGNGPLTAGFANVHNEHSRPGNILVGLWDGEEIRPTYTRNYDLLGRSMKDVARYDHVSAYLTGSGTSTSAPDAAGHYAWILWQARMEFEDTTGFHDGVLARTTEAEGSPERGPLADGELTARELEDVLRATARQVSPYAGIPPGGPASYLWEGYGLVDDESREHALRVLLGEEEMPEREWEDWWHQTFDHAREGYFTYAMCNKYIFPLSPGPNDPTAYRECVEQAEWDPTDGPSAPPSPLP